MSEKMTPRPQHPWADRLNNLPEGKGDFYHWGPNYTVDPIVFADGATPSVLLILRKKDVQWALPGGFIDPEDVSEITAARRELLEETGLDAPSSDPTLVYKGPVEDPRSTQNAWPETTALLWRVNSEKDVRAEDDAIDVLWAPLDNLPTNLYGSHSAIIRQSIESHGTFREQLAYFGDACEILPTTGGHMNYRRHIVSLPTGKRFFTKHHDEKMFDDIESALDSQEYLRKEYDVYRQLNQHTKYLPELIDLIDGHTLVLEACDPRDGWMWRAPRDTNLRERYIQEVIEAIEEIETLQFDDSSSVLPNYLAIEQDGWSEVIVHKDNVKQLLREQPDTYATQLAEALDELQRKHTRRSVRTRSAFVHADLRQSNLAWHPTHGVRIVDWSWAGPSSPGLDTTSFLIDLAKSGHDIEKFRKHFDPIHARKLLGFWLGRSIQPSRAGSTVRSHQLASAITAFRLMQQLHENS